jgi:Zn-finger nucleic acid-binding protein
MANLNCPRDRESLRTREYEGGIEVDECSACGGMWLDKGELEAIQKNADNDYRQQLGSIPNDVGASIQVTEQLDEAPIHCPKCDAEMETREYAYCSQIIVDTCPNGCGIWLDKGEIQALEIFFERAQAEALDAIPLRYRLWASLQELFRK